MTAVGDLSEAYERTVAECEPGPVDAALVQAGRTIALQIDAAKDAGAGLEVTKALYLVPHLLNVLRELLATPAARRAMKGKAHPNPASPLAQMRAAAQAQIPRSDASVSPLKRTKAKP